MFDVRYLLLKLLLGIVALMELLLFHPWISCPESSSLRASLLACGILFCYDGLYLRKPI